VAELAAVVITTTAALVGSPACCGVIAHRHGVRDVELVDLPVFGRPARLVWRKHRWRCPTCRRNWTEQDRTGPADRLGALWVDDAGGTLGDGAGRPSRPLRQRSPVCHP
jgi:zinc-finger of transposase IS204/IS1001/IS1096/IS1165